MLYMRSQFLFCIVVALSVVVSSLLVTPPVQAGSAVVVETGTSEGPVPFLFKAGMFLNDNPLGVPFRTFFDNLKPGAVEMVPIRDGTFNSLKEYEERLPSLPTTQWLSEVSRRGGQPVIALMEVPVWLRQSGHGDANYRLPRDWEGWATYVEATVRFYNRQLHLDAEYVLWDEPDLAMFWKGATEDDYFKLYQYTVLGARRADPQAKVGGPATSWYAAHGPGSDGKQPMMKRFIEFCAKTPMPEVGLKKLPVDFVVWHQFDTHAQGDPMQYLIPVEQIREWLKQGGYDSTTPLILGSWNSWLNFGKDPNELSPERDHEFAAAYVVHALVEMDRAGISQHSFFNLFENWQWNSLAQGRRGQEFSGKEFFGGFGLVNRNGIVKPVFNAFKALSLLEGMRVRVTSNDPYLSVLASSAQGVAYVLVGNFSWPEEGLMALKGRTLVANGYPLKELGGWAKALTPQLVQEVETQKRPISSLPIPESAKKELDALAYLDEFYRGRSGAKSIKVKFSNLSWQGETEVERYVVDDAHGNALRASSLADLQPMVVQRIQTNVGSQLIQWGVLQNDFLQGDAQRQGREIQTVLPRLSSEQRRKIDELVQVTTGQMLEQLNRSPEVGLAKLSFSGLSRQDDSATFDAEVKPYSINLFVLRERRK